MDKFIVAQFDCKQWHPLTDLPAKSKPSKPESSPKPNDSVVAVSNGENTVAAKCSDPDTNQDLLNSLPSNAKVLLGNITINPALTVRQRMEELDFSCRAFGSAKNELIVRKLIIEEKVGKRNYLIPTAQAYAFFGILCPYKNSNFDRHSFYLDIMGRDFKRNKAVKSVTLEYKLADSGNNADIVTKKQDGTLEAYEFTSSVTNIVQNCLKYEKCPAFSKITFVCKDSDILKAVKSKVLNAGLPVELLGKTDYVLLSSILKD